MQPERRLVYICPEYPGFARYGGIGVGMQVEAEWFAAHGHDVRVVCQTPEHAAGLFERNGVAVHVVTPSRIPKLRAFTDRLRTAALVDRLLGECPGLAICGDFAGPLWKKPARAPLVVQLHGSAMLLEDHCGPACGGRMSYFERRTVEMADALQAVSGFVARATGALARLGGIPLEVIPLSSDPGRFRSPLQPENPADVLFVGGKLTELKGIFTLASAMCPVFREFPAARLHMVARDSLIAGRSARQMFLERVPQEFHCRIHFRDQAPREEVRAIMERCGMLVVPSFVETLSVVAIEAMASARPVIASNRGGLPEVVRDGVTGFLANPDNPSAFSEAIAAVLRNPGLAARFGEAGRRRAQTAFHPDMVFGRVRDLHDRILSAQAAGVPVAAGAGD